MQNEKQIVARIVKRELRAMRAGRADLARKLARDADRVRDALNDEADAVRVAIGGRHDAGRVAIGALHD